MADIPSQTVQYMENGSDNGYATYGGGVPYREDDLFDGVAPSTAAMVILFGSIMSATVGMATRAWLWGDQRAIRAATSIRLNPTASALDITDNSGKLSHVENADEFDENNSYSVSVASRRSTTTRIRPWEPTFISTFVLFYQTTLFGLILLVVYLIDNHPPYGAARSQPTYRLSSNSEFDEDQFLFWLLVLISYGLFVSWKRNDGKANADHKSTDDHKSHLQRASDAPSEKKSDNVIRRRKFGQKAGHPLNPSIGSKSVASSEGSDDVSKRLEDVLLDDDTSFNNMLDTIDGDIAKNRDDSNEGWLVRVSILLGLPLNENANTGVIQDMKPEEEILNRHQTLEWKGFLSAAMLIYQYNNGGRHLVSLNNEGAPYPEDESTGSNRAHIYENLSKCGMTAFLFLTGYGHTSYFYYHPANNRDSYRISRVLVIIFRVNFVAIFLSLVIGKAEYMACPTITYCFMLIWLTMKLQRSINYDKYLFRLKVFGLSACIFIIWDFDLSRAFSGNIAYNEFRTIWECYCLSHLHHWAAFCGLLFSINRPIASYQLRKLESLHALTNVMAKGMIFIALIGAVISWIAGPLQMPSSAYNISHPYFGIIPVLAFIYFRNICGVMREHHVGFLSTLGKYSLEIYLLHHHAFSDSGCIAIIPGYPRCNFAIVTLLLLFAARVLHHLSTILRQLILPDNDDNKCVQHASSIAAGVTILYTLTTALRTADMMTVGIIATITIVCGILIFQTVIDRTWAEYCDSAMELPQNHHSDSETDCSTKIDIDRSGRSISPPLIGTLIFVTALGVWTSSSSALPPCGANANGGHWVPVDPCLARGRMYREFHAVNFIGPNECSKQNNKNLEWTWPENRQHAHCRYRYRNDMEVQQRLRGKKVVLIGDSSVRSLFQSLCRSFDQNSGGFEDTTPSHSDAIKIYGSSTLEYKWAPLSVDIVTKLKVLKNSGFMASKRQPDLVIAGGGTWDKLHLSVTDEDPISQRNTVIKLAKSLSQVSSPVIWFTPPTINTQALNSDEKRVQMSEESIENMRQMYEELGVTSSVSFVLDGPSFTRERVAESFDGVNYPPSTMDAGAQIIFNALDWLMVAAPNSVEVDMYLPKPGSLGNPYLGLMMICVTLIGIFFFDGYFGLSYLAQFFVPHVDSGELDHSDSVSPGELYHAAFSPIFKRLKIIQKDERDQEVNSSHYGADRHEMAQLLGRHTPSLSRRR